MDWQQIISLIIVAASAVLLVTGKIHRQRKAGLRACGHDCACSASSPLKEHREALRLEDQQNVQ